LKNNFVKLFILPTYNEQGLVIHSQTRGAIRFPGETTDRPVKLFASRGPIYHTGHAKRNDFDLDRLNLEPALDPTEARILDLYRQGESISAIATAVYGSKGGNQNEQVKTVLTRFNWGRV
jgi:hypothetical protein